MRSVGVLLSSLGFVVLLACGGGGDSPPSNNPPGNPPSNPPVTNPCAAASLEDGDISALALNTRAGRKRGPGFNRDPRVEVPQLFWTHQAARAQGLTQALDAGLPVDNEDVGEIGRASCRERV